MIRDRTMTQASRLPSSPRGPRRPRLLSASLVLLAGVGISLAAASLVHRQAVETQRNAFDQRIAAVSSALRQQLLMAIALLRGAQRWSMSNTAPDRLSKPGVLDQTELDRARSPIGELAYLAADSVFGRRTSDTTRAASGPHAAAADPGLREALRRLAGTDRIMLHGPPLSAEGTEAADCEIAALGLYLPVYRGTAPVANETTRSPRALAGFLTITFDIPRFTALINQGQTPITLRVLAGDPPASPRIGTGAELGRALLQRTTAISVAGTKLALEFAAEDRVGSLRADTTASSIALIGTVCALLASAAVLGPKRSGSETERRIDEPLNETRLIGIIRSSMEAIITIDESQTILIFNPAAERVFGVSAMEAIGRPLGRFIPERYRAAHERHIAQFGATGVSERQMGPHCPLFGLRVDGEEFPIEASISQLRDGAGKFYTVVLRDVTERLRNENALKLSREELRELSANLQHVREEEKTRIARELHDDLGQQLSALKMDMSAASQALSRVQGGPADAALLAAAGSKLDSMWRLIDSALASVRRIAADLRPVMLDDLGLVPAIEWLANDFASRYGIEVVQDVRLGDQVLNSLGSTTLFRIVQEALTNVARHADATRVDLCLKVVEDACVLRIVDNGRGARIDRPRETKSFGLIGIRERAHLLNGSVSLDSPPEGGFSLTVSLPMAMVQQGAAQT